MHYPKTPEKMAELNTLVAKFHAQYVADYISKLSCPIEQKLELIDAIAQTILDNRKKNSN